MRPAHHKSCEQLPCCPGTQQCRVGSLFYSAHRFCFRSRDSLDRAETSLGSRIKSDDVPLIHRVEPRLGACGTLRRCSQRFDGPADFGHGERRTDCHEKRNFPAFGLAVLAEEVVHNYSPKRMAHHHRFGTWRDRGADSVVDHLSNRHAS